MFAFIIQIKLGLRQFSFKSFFISFFVCFLIGYLCRYCICNLLELNIILFVVNPFIASAISWIRNSWYGSVNIVAHIIEPEKLDVPKPTKIDYGPGWIIKHNSNVAWLHQIRDELNNWYWNSDNLEFMLMNANIQRNSYYRELVREGSIIYNLDIDNFTPMQLKLSFINELKVSRSNIQLYIYKLEYWYQMYLTHVAQTHLAYTGKTEYSYGSGIPEYRFKNLPKNSTDANLIYKHFKLTRFLGDNVKPTDCNQILDGETGSYIYIMHHEIFDRTFREDRYIYAFKDWRNKNRIS
jgi:hypothetical protein